MSTTTREDLLRLTPDVYLADGYLAADGTPQRALIGEAASAAATQLRAAELAPQELGFTLEAIRQLLPLHDEPTVSERLHATLEEAAELVARTIGQPNNAGLWRWLNACAAPVGTAAELDAFLAHLDAVNRIYAMLVALEPEQSPEPPA
jgi:DNA-binding transcriptional MerR regulator